MWPCLELADADDQPLASHYSLRHFARNLCDKKIARQETNFKQRDEH
jgi:hypothetical protein